MNIGKTLIVATLLLVMLLFIGGIYYPNTLEMSFANTTASYTVLRAVIIFLLISILVTNPPRSRALRAVIGVWSLLLASVAVQIFHGYEIHLLDAIVFMQVAIILAIEALEKTEIPVTKKPSLPRKIPVISV